MIDLLFMPRTMLDEELEDLPGVEIPRPAAPEMRASSLTRRRALVPRRLSHGPLGLPGLVIRTRI